MHKIHNKLFSCGKKKFTVAPQDFSFLFSQIEYKLIYSKNLPLQTSNRMLQIILLFLLLLIPNVTAVTATQGWFSNITFSWAVAVYNSSNMPCNGTFLGEINFMMSDYSNNWQTGDYRLNGGQYAYTDRWRTDYFMPGSQWARWGLYFYGSFTPTTSAQCVSPRMGYILNDNNIIITDINGVNNTLAGIHEHVSVAPTGATVSDMKQGFLNVTNVSYLFEVGYPNSVTWISSRTPSGLSQSDCYDTSKKFVCFGLKGNHGEGDNQEKVHVSIVRTDNTIDTYYTYFKPTSGSFSQIVIDTTKTATGSGTTSKTMKHIMVQFFNDQFLPFMNVDRNVYMDMTSIYVFGSLAASNELSVARTNAPSDGAANVTLVNQGNFLWNDNYTITYTPNACSSSTFPATYSQKLCMRLKSSSTLSNSVVSVIVTTSENPSSPTTTIVTLSSSFTDVPVGVFTGSITNVKLSVDPTLTPFVIDVGSTKSNGVYVNSFDGCLMNNATTITSLLDMNFV